MSEDDFINFVGSEIASVHIPYLSSSNDVWSELLTQIEGTNFANLSQAFDGDRLDLRVSNSLISAEVKKDESPVKLNTVRDILKRIPHTSKIHFVFYSTLQIEYFTEKGRWDSDCDKNGWHHLALGKIVIENCRMRIDQLTQNVPIPKNPGCLVVFFSIQDVLVHVGLESDVVLEEKCDR